MCHSFSDLRAAAHLLVSTFEPATLPAELLSGVLSDAARIEKMMSVVTGLCAARMATLQPARASDEAARELARGSGTSLHDARRALDLARTLSSVPELESAARSGDLSRQQLGLIAPVAKTDPDAARKLVATAPGSSLQELADSAARAAAANADLEQRRARVHRARALRQWTGPDGTWHLRANGTPEDGAVIMAAIATHADKVFAKARSEGRHDGAAAYSFDGLVGLVTSGGSAAPRYEVLVRVDLEALLAGPLPPGGTCELVGFGPVSPSTVRQLIETGDPFLKAVVTKGKTITGVAHLGRRPNARQQTALDWLFPTCAVEGCTTRAAYLQTDHRVDWAKSRLTVFDLLDRLCRYHHDLKTYEGWGLVRGYGKRAFVPPEDDRHPSHKEDRRRPVSNRDHPDAARPGPAPGPSPQRRAATLSQRTSQRAHPAPTPGCLPGADSPGPPGEAAAAPAAHYGPFLAPDGASPGPRDALTMAGPLEPDVLRTPA